jgi:putative nucleotidyltransferase with HDIG domain
MNQQAKTVLQKADVDKIPSLPHILLPLLDICHDDNLSFVELAAILKQDPGLYTQFYSVCHQHMCDLSQNALPTARDSADSTLEEMLRLLGINTIKSIAVTSSVHQFFSRTSLERTDFLKQHWYHSLHCAIVAESIAKLCDYSNIQEAYTTGLLHDIGQLVLETGFPEKYTTTFAQLNEDDFFHTLELEEFGTTHQQVGAEMLREHGASNFICDAVLYHHERIEHILDAHPLVKIITLANMLTSNYFKAEDQAIFDAGKQLLNLEKKPLLDILKRSREHMKEAALKLDVQLSIDGMDDKTTKQQNAGDELKQIQLAEQVRNIALLDGVHQHLSRSEGTETLLSIIAQHVCLLFGINHCILFLYDENTERVKAIASGNQPKQLSELSIPLDSDRSLVTDALLNKQITHSFDEDIKQLSIVDRQLIGITQQEGITCLPMLMGDRTIGTLVLNVDITQHENLEKQRSLLKRFVNEIAHTISANRIRINSAVGSDASADPLQQKIREVLHEVRNPLSIMTNYLDIISYKLEGDEQSQEGIQTIKAEIDRIGDILNRLTDLDDSSAENTAVDINKLITDLSNVFKKSLFSDKKIKFSLQLDDDIKALNSNASALKQIYTNLVKNAVEAVPANSKVMVYTQGNVNVDGKPHIELCIADNGPGIDADTVPRLFSPIETSKGDDHAGLGLTIVKNLVNELQGSISCKTSDKGTSFHILLPT